MKVKNFVPDLLVTPSDLNQIPLDFYQDFSDFFTQIGTSTGVLQNGVIGSTSFLASVIAGNIVIKSGVCIASFNNASPNNDFPSYCLGSDLSVGSTTIPLSNGKLVATLVYAHNDGTRTILSPANIPTSATVQIERYLAIQYSIITGTPSAYQVYLYDVSGTTLTDRRVILFSGNNINGDGTTTSVTANTVSVKLDPGNSIIPNGSSGLKINPTQSQDMEFDGKFTINNSTAPTSSISPIVIENTAGWASGYKPNIEILAAKVQIPRETYVDDITVPGNKIASLSYVNSEIISNLLPPTIQKILTGSGTYTLPILPRKPLYIRVKMAGGGAGGSSAGAADGFGSPGTSGADSTFGTNLLIAHGGQGGQAPGFPGYTNPAGGGANFTSGIGIGITGQAGGPPIGGIGGTGGQNIFSGGAPSSYESTLNYPNGIPNTGGGGSGGGNFGGASGKDGGWGGGAGGYLDVILSSPSNTYPYSVGIGGAGGPTGVGIFYPGGNGGSGVIIVEEYYQ